MFFMGLFLGLAAASTLALVIVLSLLWSGKTLGAAPTNPSQVAVAPTGQPDPTLPPAQPVKEVDDKVDHIRGPKNAKVTLIEYSDFECPFCKRHSPTMDQALKDFPKDVRLIYRHFPLTSIHPNAQKAAEGSECAAKLGGDDAFWKFHDKMLEATAMSNDVFVQAAKAIGLNEANFKKCLDSGEMAGRVNSDAAAGNDAGVQGTPATFVNGSLVSGAVPYSEFKTMIEQAIAAK
jgi:protein-disulfide isomerase